MILISHAWKTGNRRVLRWGISIRERIYEFRHNIVKVAVGRLVDPQTTLTMLWRELIVHNRTDARKTDIHPRRRELKTRRLALHEHAVSKPVLSVSQLDKAERKERILCAIKINCTRETNPISLNHELASLDYDVQLQEQTLTRQALRTRVFLLQFLLIMVDLFGLAQSAKMRTPRIRRNEKRLVQLRKKLFFTTCLASATANGGHLYNLPFECVLLNRFEASLSIWFSQFEFSLSFV